MSQLALLGGPKTISQDLGKPWPVYNNEVVQALTAVAASGRSTRSVAGDSLSQAEQFEQKFAAFQDARYGVAVNSGTSGLLAALRAIDLQPGDEVVAPPCTFSSPIMAVLECAAVPVFADINLDTYTIDPAAVEAAITPRTKAIIGVDYAGHPCDMDALTDIARRYGLYLINDCAHAHGSQWKGRGVGAIGHMGVFSFQGSKLLPIGEGGMILTDDENLYTLLFTYHHAGRVPAGRVLPRPTLTTNMRLSEWQAAVGLAQMPQLPAQIEHRLANALYLSDLLEHVPGVANMTRDARVTRQGFYFWSFKYIVGEVPGLARATFMKALQAEGVPIGVGQTHPLYKLPLLQAMPCMQSVCCPNAEQAAQESLSISHRHFLGPKQDMELIAEAIAKVVRNAAELR